MSATEGYAAYNHVIQRIEDLLDVQFDKMHVSVSSEGEPVHHHTQTASAVMVLMQDIVEALAVRLRETQEQTKQLQFRVDGLQDLIDTDGGRR